MALYLIDQGEQADFVERRLEWLGMATTGELGHPSLPPEGEPNGSYRN